MAFIGRELITETLGYDGGRQVSVSVPPDRPLAAVYAADGGWHTAALAEALKAAGAPPTLVVGVHGRSDDDQRLQEYSPAFDPDRFEAHEAFFVDDVRRWVHTRLGVVLPSDRTGVWGASLGGELAIALALRHPDVYGVALSASPGAGYRPPEVTPGDAAARLFRRRLRGALLPRQRHPVGERAARCRGRRGPHAARRIAWWRLLDGGVPTDGDVGVGG